MGAEEGTMLACAGLTPKADSLRISICDAPEQIGFGSHTGRSYAETSAGLVGLRGDLATPARRIAVCFLGGRDLCNLATNPCAFGSFSPEHATGVGQTAAGDADYVAADRGKQGNALKTPAARGSRLPKKPSLTTRETLIDLESRR